MIKLIRAAVEKGVTLGTFCYHEIKWEKKEADTAGLLAVEE